MLVLSRKPDTAIRIGSNIEVKVLSIRNRQVKLGIDAPSSFRIWRDELCRGDRGLLEDGTENASAYEQARVLKT
jgi:carbon storage regulator CsrA